MANNRAWRICIHFILERGYKRFAEIGVAEGLDKNGLLYNILKYKPATDILEEYYAVDPWKDYREKSDEEWEKIYQRLCTYAEEKKQLKLIRKLSVDAAKLFPDSYLDIVFIDACHSYSAVREDILAWLPKIRCGGILSGHDYIYGGVKKAVDEIFGKNRLAMSYSKRTWSFEVSRNYFCDILNEELKEKMERVSGLQRERICVR